MTSAPPRRTTTRTLLRTSAVASIFAFATAAFAPPAAGPDISPATLLDRFARAAGGAADAGRGREFFTRTHGGKWSCASCHGNPPLADGKHAGTGTRIDALAPAANPRAFTDTARVDKWFKRNCNDVLKRECTPAEKADVLAWLAALPR
ncbi:MAG: DUF1924 domain-containing protein [Burkholderiaceae bacterium]|nr:DUF1924 domain-containing protein [Burkholderiaceae bacterium]